MKRFNIILAIAALGFCVAGFISQPRGNAVGTDINNIAPELKLKNPDGKEISLYSLRGNIVLVDFWASWCGPCRRENPNVVAAYNQYKDAKFKDAKKFIIYSVSLDNNHDAWVAAIKQDGLSWPNHVSDLRQWQSVAVRTYGLQSIPTNFLLNADGIIIAKELRGDALANELSKLVIGQSAHSGK